MNILKITLKLIAVLLIITFSSYLYAVYQNNRDVPMPQDAQMQQQLEHSIQWLVSHQSNILSQRNPMLWWMLYEVHKISQDKRIANLLRQYYVQNAQIKHSAWGPLFGEKKRGYLDANSVQGLPYYNKHFIYALNCAAKIENELPVVAQQNTPNFCYQSAYFYRPACITHQLMGINFMVKQQCGLLPDIDIVTQSLQQDIMSQLTWDIRVVDVYLQRVLMLLITGAETSVKHIWIQQVMDHQLDDGGWGDFELLLGPDNGHSLGFSSKGVSIGQEKSSFHATAQGVYILTYLLSEKNNL